VTQLRSHLSPATKLFDDRDERDALLAGAVALETLAVLNLENALGPLHWSHASAEARRRAAVLREMADCYRASA